MTLPEKDSQLEAIKQKMLRVRDGMGMPIDAGIFDTVVALNALGFTTVQSCEGHLDHGVAAPWVDIGLARESEAQKIMSRSIAIRSKAMDRSRDKPLTEQDVADFDEANRLQDEAQAPLMRVMQQLIELLTQFYFYRSTPLPYRLIFCHDRALTLRLQSQIALLQFSPISKNADLLPQLQQEMQDLGRFAREKFLADGIDDA